jgi:hypothetical protein
MDPLAESCSVRARAWCAEVASSYVTRLFALSLSLSTSFPLFTSVIKILEAFLIDFLLQCSKHLEGRSPRTLTMYVS